MFTREFGRVWFREFGRVLAEGLVQRVSTRAGLRDWSCVDTRIWWSVDTRIWLGVDPKIWSCADRGFVPACFDPCRGWSLIVCCPENLVVCRLRIWSGNDQTFGRLVTREF